MCYGTNQVLSIEKREQKKSMHAHTNTRLDSPKFKIFFQGNSIVEGRGFEF